jgi:hypothetical protein
MNLYTLELYICKVEKSKCKKEKYTAFPHFLVWIDAHILMIETHKSILNIHIKWVSGNI